MISGALEDAGPQNKQAEQGPEEPKDKMSADQWIALLRAQPTKENVAKLIQAFSANEVDAATFYAIVTDLFRSNQPQTQSFGINGSEVILYFAKFCSDGEIQINWLRS